jgi:hypothetical protein
MPPQSQRGRLFARGAPLSQATSLQPRRALCGSGSVIAPFAHRQGAAGFKGGIIDDDGKVDCAERLLEGEAGCAGEPLLSGVPISHPVLVFGNVGSGICFIGSAGDGAVGAGVDGLVAGGVGFVCACASPAVPSAVSSATA